MYAPEMVPIMSGLAKGFAVCDHWFSSTPTQTIPNRTFAAAATSQGHLDNHVKVFTCPSIFGRLSAKSIDWAIYGYNRDPLTRLDFTDTQHANERHFGHFRDFQTRCKNGTLPAYTFLEPSFARQRQQSASSYDVALGELLIHDTYYAVRNGPGWADTLLLITSTSTAAITITCRRPRTRHRRMTRSASSDFDFKRFGVRVPALLISPRIAAGTVFRAKRGTIDHTSAEDDRAEMGPRSGDRNTSAPDLGDVLTLAVPRTDDPLQGVPIPVANVAHPEQAEPSLIEMIHAHKVALLPLRNDQGSYDRHTPPDLSTSAQIGDYIQGRTAAWTQHLERKRAEREARAATSPRRSRRPASRPRKAAARKSRSR
jgi:phospholipase C